MKQLILTLLDRRFVGTVVRYLFGFLRHQPKVFGLTNPLYVSHYFVQRDGCRYLAAGDTYLVLQSMASQIVKLDPRIYESEIAFLSKTLVRPDDTVLDIGANVGLHTVAFARAAYRGHVYAFEPVAEMAERLSLNCSLNGLDNVTVMNFALGNEVGEAEMNVNVAGAGMEGTSSFIDSVHVQKHPHNYQPRKIQVQRLDDLMAQIKLKRRIGFIKVDTEGFEPMVLRGGLKTIQKHRPAMIIEAHSTRLAKVGLSFQWYLETFPDYHALIVYSITPANPYLRLEPLGDEPPEIAVNLLLLPRTPSWEPTDTLTSRRG